VYCTRPWDPNLADMMQQRIAVQLYNHAQQLQKGTLVVHASGNAGFCLWTELRQAWLLSHAGPRNGHSCSKHSPSWNALAQLPSYETVAVCMVHHGGPFEIVGHGAIVAMCCQMVEAIETRVLSRTEDDSSHLSGTEVQALTEASLNHRDSVILRDFVDGPFNLFQLAMVNDHAAAARAQPRLFCNSEAQSSRYIGALEKRIPGADKCVTRKSDRGLFRQDITDFVSSTSEHFEQCRIKQQTRRSIAGAHCAC